MTQNPGCRARRPAPPGWVWIEEAALYTGLAKQTLYNRRQKGEAPHGALLGRRLAYKLEDLDAWREEQLNPEPNPERERESRPAEPRIHRAAA